MIRDMTSRGGDSSKLLDVLRAQCTKLPGAEEYVMVHHPAFRVGKKPYAIVGMEEGARGSTTLSINLGPELQRDLLADARFERTHYIGQHGWVTALARTLESGELLMLVEQSYRRIAGKKQLALLDGARAPAKSGAVKAAKSGAATPAKSDAAKATKKPPAKSDAAKASKKPPVAKASKKPPAAKANRKT